MRFAALTVAAACLVELGCAAGPKVGAQGGAFTALDAHGKSLASGDFGGKVTVLYFWATWCAPCVVSSPAMQALHERYAGDDRVQVVGVHFDAVGKPVEYSRRHGYTFTLIPDGGVVVDAYQIRKIPQIVVLSAEGTVVFTQVGFREGDEEKIMGAIEAHR